MEDIEYYASMHTPNQLFKKKSCATYMAHP